MINRWILRFKLWWYDVCPEHGPMQRGWNSSWCTKCYHLRGDRHKSHVEKLQRQYRAATFNGPEDAREDFHNPGGCA